MHSLQRARSVVPRHITAVFAGTESNRVRVGQIVQLLKQVASGLTVVITKSLDNESETKLSIDNLFYIDSFGSSTTAITGVIQKAISLSPSSDSILMFNENAPSTLSERELRKIVSSQADYLLRSVFGCTKISMRYAKHVVETGETPSARDAITNGFSSPMSIFQIIKSPKDAIKQYSTIVKFCLVGISGVAVNLIALTLLKRPIGALTANVVAQELAIISNFTWNDRFTFRTESSSGSFFSLSRLYRFVKYNLVSLLSLAVNEIVFYVAYSQGLYYIWCSLIAIATAFVINYFGSSRWAWAKSLSVSVKD